MLYFLIYNNERINDNDRKFSTAFFKSPTDTKDRSIIISFVLVENE